MNCCQDEEVVLDYDTDSELCCTCRQKPLSTPLPTLSTPVLPATITTQPTVIYHTPTTSTPSEFSAYLHINKLTSYHSLGKIKLSDFSLTFPDKNISRHLAELSTTVTEIVDYMKTVC